MKQGKTVTGEKLCEIQGLFLPFFFFLTCKSLEIFRNTSFLQFFFFPISNKNVMIFLQLNH